MAIFKCKMCGGTLEINATQSTATCEYCGTQQTLPKLDDEKRANLYDRANHFRRNNEFDKAENIYEQILNEDGNDAEAYWSLVLCRYGIEYVEDPATHKRVPTVNRAQFTSVFDDDNYLSALRLADEYQKAIYEKEARAINEIQKGILAISQNEQPFDVFICYKETDSSGRRTQDSVLANDLYHQLTEEGFKVFFARITLEDKLGSAYEPYIFAALNSAKVMVVLGTKPEYFNAVWVRNEWSRYLQLVKQAGGKKILIPAYRDMDPYDLPEEFSHLQAQDMSKLGFMQDLIRGIKKLAGKEEKSASVAAAGSATEGAAVDRLLKRAFMFLEDGDFESAEEYSEKVLDHEPENAQAYLARLMAELKCTRMEKLQDMRVPFDSGSTYQRVMQFGDDTLKARLQEANQSIRERNEEARLNELYTRAAATMQQARRQDEYERAAAQFEEIAGYRDAIQQAETCYELAEEARKESIFLKAVEQENIATISSLTKAKELYEQIPGYKNTDERLKNTVKWYNELDTKIQKRLRAAKRKKLIKRLILVGVPVIIVLAVLLNVLSDKLAKSGAYDDAKALYEAGNLEQALSAFREMGDYEDAEEQVAAILGEHRDWAQAGDMLTLGSYVQNGEEAEPIYWRVLSVEENRMLLIADTVLEIHGYHDTNKKITWEGCSLRKWLNGDFYNTAFSDADRQLIQKTTLKNPNNPETGSAGGKDTQDHVFCLSLEEMEQYIGEKGEYAKGTVTEHLRTTDRVDERDEFVSYWTRSPGGIVDFSSTGSDIEYYAAITNSRGEIMYFGNRVDVQQGVRPAVWITR